MRPGAPENATKRCEFYSVCQGIALTVGKGARQRGLGLRGALPLAAALGVQQRAGAECEAEQQPLDGSVGVVGGFGTADAAARVTVGARAPLKERDGERRSHSKEQAAQAPVAGPETGDGVAERRARGRGLAVVALL